MGFGAVLGQSRNTGATPTTSTGKRTARFSIGSSTNGWTANDCDYLCDGTDDQVEINAAIQALPSGGGEIVILDGTYNISATISINKDNVTLSGNGNNTVLVRQWEAPSSGTVSTFPVVSIWSRENINISLLCIDGNSFFGSSNNIGIYIYDSDNTKIKQCKFINNGVAITSSNSNSIEITDNYFLNNYNSIRTVNNNLFFIIKGNFILNTSNYAIEFSYSSSVSEYFYQTNSVITDNLIDTANYGVYINGSEIIITNNIVTNCVNYGIRIFSSALGIFGNNNNISGNIIIKGSNAYSGYVGLSLSSYSQYNLVANNHLINGANISNQGTSNTVTNNIYN